MHVAIRCIYLVHLIRSKTLGGHWKPAPSFVWIFFIRIVWVTVDFGLPLVQCYFISVDLKYFRVFCIYHYILMNITNSAAILA